MNSIGWRNRLHEIIFEADTPEGKLFDVILLWCILLSVLTVILDSVSAVSSRFGSILLFAEFTFTFLFTAEYLLRVICVKKPIRYIFSFFGIVDFLAIVPTYLSFFTSGYKYMLVIRTVRLLRVFRILKLARFLGEAEVLMAALRASRYKITVFLGAVLVLVMLTGSMIYVIEGEANGFTSIPRSMYWAIVTLTTVGYGDITPKTMLGQTLSAFVMILGYGVIAVPTGIVSVELSRASHVKINTQACRDCGRDGHDSDALFCKYCGGSLQ